MKENFGIINYPFFVRHFVFPNEIKDAEQVLIDNGIEPDEASTVLQAIGYALLNVELYPDTNITFGDLNVGEEFRARLKYIIGLSGSVFVKIDENTANIKNSNVVKSFDKLDHVVRV